MNVSRSSHGPSDVLCIGRCIAGPAGARHGGETEAERDTAHINDFSSASFFFFNRAGRGGKLIGGCC